MYSVFVQERPASVVLNTPRSAFSVQRFPTAATKATLGSTGSSTTRPIERVSCKPRYVHDSPPSTDRYTPPPQELLCRLLFSPVPAQTILGSRSKIASAPNVLS